MKKEYINPEIEIFKIETMQMIASSEEIEKKGGDDTTDTYDAPTWFGLGGGDEDTDW